MLLGDFKDFVLILVVLFFIFLYNVLLLLFLIFLVVFFLFFVDVFFFLLFLKGMCLDEYSFFGFLGVFFCNCGEFLKFCL